jgi:hypothetical protein
MLFCSGIFVNCICNLVGLTLTHANQVAIWTEALERRLMNCVENVSLSPKYLLICACRKSI